MIQWSFCKQVSGVYFNMLLMLGSEQKVSGCDAITIMRNKAARNEIILFFCFIYSLNFIAQA